MHPPTSTRGGHGTYSREYYYILTSLLFIPCVWITVYSILTRRHWWCAHHYRAVSFSSHIYIYSACTSSILLGWSHTIHTLYYVINHIYTLTAWCLWPVIIGIYDLFIYSSWGIIDVYSIHITSSRLRESPTSRCCHTSYFPPMVVWCGVKTRYRCRLNN